MKKFIPLIFIITLYILLLLILKPRIFSYKFDKSIIKQYLCSQDIPYEPPCKRIFLSDGDIHIAASYLYITGSDPTEFNFQHTPFIKYLYGLTILITNNPFLLEVILGIIYLLLTYLISLKVFKSNLIAEVSTLLLSIDPLLLSITNEISLELGQACLLLIYIYWSLYRKDNIIIQGIILGLFASAKFWGAVPFFMMFIYGYKIIKKEFNFKNFLLHLIIGFITYSLTYLKTFINHQGAFNIIFYQFKLLKYWLNHSISNIPFASIMLFMTGWYKSWWNNKGFLYSSTWSILWPLTIYTSLIKIFNHYKSRKLDQSLLIALIPVAYLFYLGAQAPFSRYFILILPFLYMTLSAFIVDKLRKISC